MGIWKQTCRVCRTRRESWNIKVGNKIIKVHNTLWTRLQILSCSRAKLMLQLFQAGIVFPLGSNRWLNAVFLLAEQPGEAEQAGQAVPLPRVAGDRDSCRREGDDRPHCSCAEAAAADREPPHHCALQVSPLCTSAWLSSAPVTPLFPFLSQLVPSRRVFVAVLAQGERAPS